MSRFEESCVDVVQSPRITEQDEELIAKVKCDAVREFCAEFGLFNPEYDDQEYIEVSRYKLKDHCDEILNKLNAKSEISKEVTHHPL